MESQVIRTVLKRCRLEDIAPILRKWNALSAEFVRGLDRKKKWQTAAEVVEECEDCDVTIDSAGLLDLICLQLTSDKKTWEVYSIKTSHEGESTFPTSDPDQFNKELKALLSLYFGRVHTNINIYAGFLWGRVHFVPSVPRKRAAAPVYQPSDVVYFVYPPHTRMLVATKMKLAYKSSFIKAMQRLFTTDQISVLRLSGHDVFSLVDLVVNKNNQSSFGQYRSQARAENPLVRRKRRRDPEEEEEAEQERDPRVVCENTGQKQARQAYLDRIYGPHPAPTLEKLKYKMEVKFRGTNVVPAMAEDEEPFEVQVAFTGTSVLGGLKSLPRHGYATTPLPKHVSRVQSLAMNYIHIKENK